MCLLYSFVFIFIIYNASFTKWKVLTALHFPEITPLTVLCLSSRFFPKHILCISCSLFLGYSSTWFQQGSFLCLLQVVIKHYLPWLLDLKSQYCQHLHPCLFLAASHIKQTILFIYLIDVGLPPWNVSPIRARICLICSQLCLPQLEQCLTHSRCSINTIEWMETNIQNCLFPLQHWDRDT